MIKQISSILITATIAFGTLVMPALSQNAAKILEGFAENQAEMYRSLTANNLNKDFIKSLPDWTQSAKGWQDNVVKEKPETKNMNIQWGQALPAADALLRDSIINAKPAPQFSFIEPSTIRNFLDKTPLDGINFNNPAPLPLVTNGQLMSTYQTGDKRFIGYGK